MCQTTNSVTEVVVFLVDVCVFVRDFQEETTTYE